MTPLDAFVPAEIGGAVLVGLVYWFVYLRKLNARPPGTKRGE